MEELNKLIVEINGMIKHMFENKIFLLHIVIAVIVVVLGIMSNLNEISLAILILTIASSLRGSINYSLVKDDEKKLATGTMLLFNAVCAMIIGYILFIQVNHISLNILYNKICNSDTNVYLLALIVPTTISILTKIITRSGEPLYGGIISGHSAFCVTVYLISINQHIIFLLLLLIPIITIIKPRYSNRKCKIAPALIITILGILFLLYLRINIIIVLSHIMLIPLLIGTKNAQVVHKKREILYGIITGIVTTIFILLIFNRINVFL